jgi:hypothetical protein
VRKSCLKSVHGAVLRSPGGLLVLSQHDNSSGYNVQRLHVRKLMSGGSCLVRVMVDGLCSGGGGRQLLLKLQI